jgi:hypothetical protein
VRAISDVTFTSILAAADAVDPTAGRRRRDREVWWASPQIAQLVEEISMNVAVAYLEETYPDAKVRRMPHNNPGYDVRIEAVGEPSRYVEVKGTTRGLPHFFMSEGERLFSHDHSAAYTLLVIYEVDTIAGTGLLLRRDGAVGGEDLWLQPVQWEGGFIAAPAA